MATQKRTSKTITGFAATRGARDLMKQAASDLEHGRMDTGRRGAIRITKRSAKSTENEAKKNRR